MDIFVMKIRTSLLRAILVLVGLPAGLAGAAPTEAPGVVALSSLQPGLWTIRSRDPDGPPPRQLCMTDPRILLQLRHEGQACSRFVVTNDAQSAVVTYSCPGRGNGRTTVRVETPRVAQIDSQGIADNSPFDWALEARRVGDCPASARTRTKRTEPLSFR
jgi:hypothetical protein